MRTYNKQGVIFLLLLGLCGSIAPALATHISQPIVTDIKTQVTVGETVVLRGWVNYNNQAAPDVLLHFKVTRPDDTTAVEQSFQSNAEGRFEFTFDTQSEAPGMYRITVTSHCLDMHRYACTYKNQTVSIQLTR